MHLPRVNLPNGKGVGGRVGVDWDCSSTGRCVTPTDTALGMAGAGGKKKWRSGTAGTEAFFAMELSSL